MSEKSRLSIKSIKEILRNNPSEEALEELSADPRKGVISALSSYYKKRAKQKAIDERTTRLYKLIEDARLSGFSFPCGIDEAGRGPLAGPVVAACVVLPLEPKLEVYDSKKVPEKKRDELFDQIMEHAESFGVGIVSAHEIDELNIYRATQRAMTKAWEMCSPRPDFCFIDAMELDIDCRQQSLVKGDAKCAAISAASIIAKVTRDRIMIEAAQKYAQYGFESHKGYGSAMHIKALEQHGPCPMHRTSFAPVSDYILPTREWFETLLRRCTSIQALRTVGLRIRENRNDLLDSELEELRETYQECLTFLSSRGH